MNGVTEEPDPTELARLEAALASLRRLDRGVFLANRVDAMTYDEIAAVTGLIRKQVTCRMARAVRDCPVHEGQTPAMVAALAMVMARLARRAPGEVGAPASPG